MPIDVTDAEFETRVVERSKEVPVVVDLWAPWCGPCRQLGPVLDNLEAEYNGKFELVKINIDENPQVATALRAQSIPLVIGIRDGQIVSQFVGAQPPQAIRQFLDEVIPSALEQLVVAAGNAIQADDLVTAAALLAEAEEIDPKHQAIVFCRGSLLMAQEMYEDAIALLSKIPSDGHDEVARLIAQAKLKSAAGTDLEQLASAAESGDLDAMISYGLALGGQGESEQALEALLAAVIKDPQWNDGAARKAMIDLFEVLGNSDPLTRQYRGKLSRALH